MLDNGSRCRRPEGTFPFPDPKVNANALHER
ncbi:MAG: hypothetical protein RLZZ445_770 [Pseudomonadota bacterium]